MSDVLTSGDVHENRGGLSPTTNHGGRGRSGLVNRLANAYDFIGEREEVTSRKKEKAGEEGEGRERRENELSKTANLVRSRTSPPVNYFTAG